MKKREIGTSGIAVTRLSFGGSSLASMPDTYGYEVDEARAKQTIEQVFAGPVTMLDTSRNYGMGRSEARIGEVIRQRGGLPEGFALATKLDRDMTTGHFDASRARRSLEESLEALGLDRVPILHLHDPEYAADLETVTGSGGALEELFKIKQEGLADLVGLAMGRLDMMVPILKDWPFDVLINHNRYTLLNRQADQMFDYAFDKGIGIFNAAPFAGGVLAKGSSQVKRITYQDVDEEALAPVRAFESLCAEFSVDLGAVALQFSMRDPRITSTIVGVSRPESIERNLAWAKMEIPPAFWAQLAQIPYSTDDPEANRVYKPD
ncbi:MAG: aldo/keto reductase [Pseudomonadota bacterium]